MALSSQSACNRLRTCASAYDPDAVSAVQNLLVLLRKMKLEISPKLKDYHDLLLFLVSHPANSTISSLAEAELKRIASILEKASNHQREKLADSGLPYCTLHTKYSHDMIRQLLEDATCTVTDYTCYMPLLTLNEVLRTTLPAVEREKTAAGMTNEELLADLGLKKEQELPFIINEFSRYDAQPFLKDQLFDTLQVYVTVKGKHKTFSRSYNRIPVPAEYYHSELLKRIDHSAWLEKAVPAPRSMNEEQRAGVVQAIRRSLTLELRETDPSTYLDAASLRVYDLERGISIAFYTMTPDRQLTLESYVGFTLFKNGLPASYGGAWVFGRRALFGINVFEPYRGGESGVILCQLLRTYRQVFNIDYFEVEPYQYGGGNPEGIASGAYWFYFRFGFRSLDPALEKLAEQEMKKIGTKKGYRSSEKTLLRFTESNIALNLNGKKPVEVAEVTARISALIQKAYKGDRLKAERESVAKLEAYIGKLPRLTAEKKSVLIDFALWAEAYGYKDKMTVSELLKLALLKPVDLYTYQQELHPFLKTHLK